jgi:serine/threonine protein phosphatase PrpC
MGDQPLRLANDAERMSAIARRTQSAAPPRVDCHGLSHAGKVRQTNEDHFVIMTLQRSVQLLHTNLDDVGVIGRLSRPEAYVFVAADGVAGLVGGHFASGLAVRSVIEYVAETASCYHGSDAEREDEFIDQLTQAVDRAHRRLKDGFGDRGPATTLTMVTLVWPRAYVVHAGDSRGYHLRRGRLRQFTADQTIGDMVVDQGRATEQQARELGLHNILASAVGAELTPAVGLIDLEPEDVLLLCTDGLTKHVSDERIAQLIAAAPDAESACRALLGDSLEEGGTDNVTVIVARMAAEHH